MAGQYNPAMESPQGAPYRYGSLGPADLRARIAAGRAPRLIDLREPCELGAGQIEGAESLPLSEVWRWWSGLDPEEEIVFQCRRGNRSRALCCVLAIEGFRRLFNLEGGFDAWLETEG
jgi:rhodanese-related sulfurtransferase